MAATIILPTYNERQNLAGVVEDIFRLGIPALRIVIVDDNSPDGTGRLADELARTHDSLSVIHRQRKAGLGKAYLAGFQRALADPDCAFIFEMDADFSHQPKYVPAFLEAIQSADLVIGSRYISGGSVSNWGWGRRAISWFANTVIRHYLRVPVRDLTAGFKCFRREVLEKLELERVSSRGYNFQIEMTYRVVKQGFRVREIPITFVERKLGESKFNVGIMVESLLKVLWLPFRRERR